MADKPLPGTKRRGDSGESKVHPLQEHLDKIESAHKAMTEWMYKSSGPSEEDKKSMSEQMMYKGASPLGGQAK